MSDLTSEIINLDETYSQLKITPVLLAAQRNSISILERLLASGINYVPVPHRVGCCCVACASARKSDCLRLSRFRLDVNRAKASEALLLLTETDPLTKAFQLAYEYRELSLVEVEFREEYLELAESLEVFSCTFISFVWSSSEIESIMRFDDPDPVKRLDVLTKAVKYRQSKFTAQPHCQQLLNRIWYGEFAYYRCIPGIFRFALGAAYGVLWPIWCSLSILLPNTKLGKMILTPMVQFVCATASYVTFLIMLSASSVIHPEDDHPGPHFTILDLFIFIWLLGMLFKDSKFAYNYGVAKYMRQEANILSAFLQLSFFVAYALKFCAWVKYGDDMTERQNWPADHPTLLAEAFFAVGTVISFLRFFTFYTVNRTLGPLQISFSFSIGMYILSVLKRTI